MKLLVCFFSLTLCAVVLSETLIPAKKKTEFSKIGNKTRTLQRQTRQIGYGSAGAGINSQLSGISSGYGYGYNNAVGLTGLGQNAGAGTVIAPLGVGYGGIGGYGGYGGYGYPGYGAGYYGGNGYGLNGYGGYGANGLNSVGAAGGAGWGSGSVAAPAVGQAVVPVAAAVVPTTGVATTGGAYGRSDDAVAPISQQTNAAAINPTQQTNQGFNGQASFPTTSSNNQFQG